MIRRFRKWSWRVAGTLSTWLVVVAAVLLAHCQPDPDSHVPDESAITGWLARNATPITTTEPGQPLDDLEPLREIVGEARVVLLGESRHDTREQFRLKHRMVEFLVERMGFTVIIIEEGLPYTRLVDEFVHGGGLDAHDLLNGMGYWDIWSTEEGLGLLTWIRETNETRRGTQQSISSRNAQPEIFVFGMDVMHPRLGVENALAFLQEFDRERASALASMELGLEIFDDTSWVATAQRYDRLSGEERDALGANLDALVGSLERGREALIARSSLHEYGWALREAIAARSGHAVFASDSRLQGGLRRDRAMAENVLWVAKEAAPGARIIVWAANVHVAKGAIRMPEVFPDRILGTGHHLYRALGEDLVAIGATFGEGELTHPGLDDETRLAPAGMDYVEGVLSKAAAGRPSFLVDLRAPRGSAAVDTWISQPHRMRSQHMDMSCRVSDSFDALFFVNRVSRSTPLPGAIERMQQ